MATCCGQSPIGPDGKGNVASTMTRTSPIGMQDARNRGRPPLLLQGRHRTDGPEQRLARTVVHAVGSPSIPTVPRPLGAAGSVMSTNPRTPSGLSE